MVHAIGFKGNETVNNGLQGVYGKYMERNGTLADIDTRPSGVDGVFFTYMHRGKDRGDAIYVATGAQYLDFDIELDMRVVLVKARHTDGKGFCVKPSRFGDASAANLLSDMIAA